MSDQWIDDWLGAPRFQRYVSMCNGDRARALTLYEWNIELGQAVMHDIAHFEVALRNCYDRAISSTWTKSTHWLMDAESPAVMPIWRTKNVRGIKRGSDVNFVNRRKVDEAIKGAGYGKATPGKVMAELSLGFWRQLTTSAMEKSMWVPHVHHAYPAGTSRADVDSKISQVNILRNRIAHHEPLSTAQLNASSVHSDMLQCLALLSQPVHAHVLSTSRVVAVNAQRP